MNPVLQPGCNPGTESCFDRIEPLDKENKSVMRGEEEEKNPRRTFLQISELRAC